MDGIGDRRPVTVLFADISGFTPLMESMDAERVLSFLNGMFSGLLSVIREYGGTVDKFLGDAVMVVFGAPEVRIDDRERAMLCALAIRREFLEFIQTGPKEFADVSISIGVNTGRAVAGIVGDVDYREYTVFGSAVNTAARLESAAKPGEILVGPETAAGLDPFFLFEDAPPLHLKGIEGIFSAKILVDKRDVFKPTAGRRGFEDIPVINSVVERTTALLLSGRNVQIIVMPGGGRSIVTEALYSIWPAGRILHVNEITGTGSEPDGQSLTVYSSLMAFENSSIRRAPAVVFSQPDQRHMDGFEQIDIPPLTRRQVRDLAARLHSTELISSDTLEHIFSLSQGRTGHVYQMLRTADDIAGQENLPKDIRQLFAQRMDSLPPAQRDTILRAAVISTFSGRVSMDVLNAMSDGVPDIPDGYLCSIGGDLLFSSSALERTARSMLFDSRKQEVHNRVASILAELDAPKPLVGLHFQAGGDNRNAFLQFCAAGESENPVDAAANLERAVAYGIKAAEKWGLMLHFHRAASLLGQYVWMSGDLRRVVRLSVLAFRAAGDNEGRARVLNSLSVALDELGHSRFARTFLERATFCSESESLKLEIGTNLGINISESGDLEGGLAVYRGLEDIARSNPEWPGSAQLFSSIGWVERELGHFDEARAAYLEALALDISTGDRHGQAIDRLNIAVIEIDTDRLDRAESELLTALPIFWSFREQRGRINTICALGEVFRKKGLFRKAIPQLKLAMKLAESIGDTELLEEALEQRYLAEKGA